MPSKTRLDTHTIIVVTSPRERDYLNRLERISYNKPYNIVREEKINKILNDTKDFYMRKIKAFVDEHENTHGL